MEMTATPAQDHKLLILNVLSPNRAKPHQENSGTASKEEWKLPLKPRR